ncbi:ABC transporter permease [Nocardioides zeae]|uniref:ABC transporter permease n=1 Tax=Nocardioides imazamoxiresistens TaxID=3231893 RepID=A0ABU3PYB0_9ACTN|nr:ABC transporter permease [Nocardioides zeae]MDT9593886.1 ABC transporter permease [Nocardioides zeae]
MNPDVTVTPPPEGGHDVPETKQEQGKSQGQLIRRRFMANKLALVSIVVLGLVALLGITSLGVGPIPGWWKWGYAEAPPLQNGGGRPTLELWPFSLGDHPFGQHRTGKDYFAMVMRGIQNSFLAVFIMGAIATVLGSVVGALAGYYRGWVDAILMRMTDLVIVVPVLVLGAVIGRGFGANGVVILSIFLGLVLWTGLARLVRAEFLSLREREFVDAARVAGASDARIIFKHIFPNAIGVVIVTSTLVMASAILLEAALSFLNLGVKPPDVSLGYLISENSAAFKNRPYLFWWPGLFIILIALSINFIGDGLRDAFDPRQTRFNARKTVDRDAPVAAVDLDTKSTDASGAADGRGTGGPGEGRS